MMPCFLIPKTTYNNVAANEMESAEDSRFNVEIIKMRISNSNVPVLGLSIYFKRIQKKSNKKK